MNARLGTLLAAAALLSRPLVASAHEVSCEKTVGIVATDASGKAVLDAAGNPTFLAGTSPILVIDQYPVTIGWKIRVNNLAADTSIVRSFLDPFLAIIEDLQGIAVFGLLPGPGTPIPEGASTEAIVLQRVGSFDGCLSLGASGAGIIPAAQTATEGSPFAAPACRDARENVATVTTERDIAQCRAKIVCVSAQTTVPEHPPIAP